jgi:hypothetical protein
LSGKKVLCHYFWNSLRNTSHYGDRNIENWKNEICSSNTIYNLFPDRPVYAIIIALVIPDTMYLEY